MMLCQIVKLIKIKMIILYKIMLLFPIPIVARLIDIYAFQNHIQNIFWIICGIFYYVINKSGLFITRLAEWLRRQT